MKKVSLLSKKGTSGFVQFHYSATVYPLQDFQSWAAEFQHELPVNYLEVGSSARMVKWILPEEENPPHQFLYWASIQKGKYYAN